MQILIIGDCHGEMPELPESRFDLVLAVGDICGGTDEMRKYMFEAIDSNQTWYEFQSQSSQKYLSELYRASPERDPHIQQYFNCFIF